MKYMLDNDLMDEKYLYIGNDRQADRIYLEDYFDSESIHYFCEEWLSELMGLLKESGNKTLYAEVKRCYKEMGQ